MAIHLVLGQCGFEMPCSPTCAGVGPPFKIAILYFLQFYVINK